SFRISRSAAALLRRDCTRQSSASPSASTARQRYILFTEHLIEVPGCMRLRTHHPQTSRDSRPEYHHPTSDRLVGNVDAAFGEQFLDIPEAQRKAKIEPDRVLDDRRRKR